MREGERVIDRYRRQEGEQEYRNACTFIACMPETFYCYISQCGEYESWWRIYETERTHITVVFLYSPTELLCQ